MERQIWFITGSQHLYGSETLRQVAANAETISQALDADASISVKVVFKPIVTTPDEIRATCTTASGDSNCIGLITEIGVRGIFAKQVESANIPS